MECLDINLTLYKEYEEYFHQMGRGKECFCILVGGSVKKGAGRTKISKVEETRYFGKIGGETT